MQSMSFEEAWYAATYNMYWYMTFCIPLIAASLAVVLAAFLRSRWAFLLLLFIAIPSTYFASVNAITRKWDLRLEAAKTESEMSRVAGNDGANLVAGALIIAPFEAVFYNAIAFGVAGVVFSSRKTKEKSPIGEAPFPNTRHLPDAGEINGNPYSPPRDSSIP